MIAAAAIVALGVTIGLLFSDLVRIFHDIVAGFVKVLGIIFYIFSYVFFLIIDFLEITFKRIIGLKGTYSIEIDGTRTTSGDDLVITLINSKTVQNIFWALSIIALFLLVVSVIIAIIRSEYQWDKAGNSKGPIFGKALKAIALYLTVPVACIFGVWGASQLLKALDQATSGGKETYISSMAFAASATTGNRLQSSTLWEALEKEYTEAGGDLTKTGFCARFVYFAEAGYGGASHSDVITALTSSDSAQKTAARQKIENSINEAFRASYGVEEGKSEGQFGFSYNAKSSSETYNFSKDNEDYSVLWLIRNSVPQSGVNYVCSPYSLDMVYFYYGLVPGAGGVGWGYNHILSILVSFLILKVLFDITCGVLKRAYELVVLYVISPPVVALMPLDDGSAYKSWVKSFIGKTLMAYGGVLAINFFFLLVPIFNTISIFTTANGLSGAQAVFFGGSWISGFFDVLVRLLFVLAGAFSMGSLSKMISGIIGAEDAAESGSAISGAVGGMVGKLGGLALSPVKNLAKGAIKLTSKKNDKEDKAEKDKRAEQIKKLEGGNAQQRMEAEQMKQTDALKAIQASGGGSGGGGKKDDGMGNGKIANFVRDHVTGGAFGKTMSAIGSLYGGALNNATGGELGKGFEAGQKAGDKAVGAISAIGKGVVKTGKNIKNANDQRRFRKLSAQAQRNLGITLSAASSIADRQAVNAEMHNLATQSRSFARRWVVGLGRRNSANNAVVNSIESEGNDLAQIQRKADEMRALYEKSTTDKVSLESEGTHQGTFSADINGTVTPPAKPKKKAKGTGVKRGPMSEEAKARMLAKRRATLAAKAAGQYKGSQQNTTKGTIKHEAGFGSESAGKAEIRRQEIKDTITKSNRKHGLH